MKIILKQPEMLSLNDAHFESTTNNLQKQSFLEI